MRECFTAERGIKMERFTGKTVLITGAGDMAKAIGERILTEGGKIAYADFSQAALDESVALLKEKGFNPDDIMAIPCNVKSQADCDHVVAEMIKRWGKVDALVATAGIIRHMPIDEMSEQDWQDVIDINLTGIFHSCKVVVPSMKERKYGRIVLISSIGGRTGRKVGVNYAASKAGVNGITMNLAYMLGEWNITVNAIAPGPLKGRMFYAVSKEEQQAFSANIPLKRLGEFSEVAATVAYLASDDAAWTSGEIVDVNGGLF